MAICRPTLRHAGCWRSIRDLGAEEDPWIAKPREALRARPGDSVRRLTVAGPDLHEKGKQGHCSMSVVK
jgi:hypothetical protein